MEKYKFLIVPFVSLFICQTLKFTIESIKCKKLKWGRLFNGTGGMPSSHTTFVFSLTFTLGFDLGIYNPLFVLSLVFSIVTGYDAMGLRMESGRQAEAINMLLDEVFETKEGLNHLKESLGHKPLEVLMGIILALIISIFFINIIF